MKVYEMTIADIASEIFDKGEDFAEKIFNDIDELEKNKLLEINKLKQQLAETEQKFLEFQEDSIRNEQIYVRELAEKDKEIKSLIVDYEKRISQEQELMSNMEQQLAEKQKTIDEINKEFVQAIHDWKTLCAEKDKEIEDWKQKTQTFLNRVNEQNYEIANNNPKQLAIQELEKVKHLLVEKMETPTDKLNCFYYIDQQIKELKGEN